MADDEVIHAQPQPHAQPSAHNRESDQQQPYDDNSRGGFVCEVLAVDEAPFVIQKRRGELWYVQLLRGSLPAPLSNTLVHAIPAGTSQHRTLLGRPRATCERLPLSIARDTIRSVRPRGGS